MVLHLEFSSTYNLVSLSCQAHPNLARCPSQTTFLPFNSEEKPLKIKAEVETRPCDGEVALVGNKDARLRLIYKSQQLVL
jgi:hypothetical protein